MDATTPDAISFRTGNDPVDLNAESSAQASSIQAALNKRQIRTYKWPTQAERLAQVGMQNGDEATQLDTGQQFRWDGSMWKNVSPGLVPIVPVSGNGVLIGTTLKFTGASTVSVTDIFNQGFLHYRAVISIDAMSVNSTMLVRARTSSGDISAANSYTWTRESSTGSTYSTASAYTGTGTDTFPIFPFNFNTGAGATIEWLQVGMSTLPSSYAMITGGSRQAGAAPVSTRTIATMPTGVNLTGFTLLPQSSSNISGTIQIYGYN